MDELSTVTLDQVREAVLTPEGRRAYDVIELSKGACAVVYTFTGPARTMTLGPCDADGPHVPLNSVIVKVGKWKRVADLYAEVDIQRTANELGLAPAVYDFAVVGKAGAKVSGVVVMQRLTQPTYYRWLHWISREHRRSCGQGAGSWSIDRDALQLPAAKAWEHEAVRLRKALRTSGINHGDWHERNLVFDVPEVRERFFDMESPRDCGDGEGGEAEYKSLKHVMIEAIQAGPEAGRARLYVIDFGEARRIESAIEQRCAWAFFSRRIVDDSEEAPSNLTRQHTTLRLDSRTVGDRVKRLGSRRAQKAA